MRKLISVLVLSIFLPLNVFASIKSEVIVENKDLYKGDSLIVTIRLNQDSHKDEINILQGIIEYDESLFEDIDEESFKTMSNWADFEYNSETHSLVVINRYGTNLNEDIITFKIPLKKDVNPAATSIGFKDALVSNDKGDFALEDTDSNVNINVSLSELTGGKNPAPVYGKALENSQVRIYYILTIVVLELVIAVILLLIYNVAKKKYTDLPIEGEMQFDAAVSPRVARTKCPESEVAGHANTFIFPDINSGNIGYKIAQRMGNFDAYGPILLGLNAPVNDLSRGCNASEVYSMAIITAALA